MDAVELSASLRITRENVAADLAKVKQQVQQQLSGLVAKITVTADTSKLASDIKAALSQAGTIALSGGGGPGNAAGLGTLAGNIAQLNQTLTAGMSRGGGGGGGAGGMGGGGGGSGGGGYGGGGMGGFSRLFIAREFARAIGEVANAERKYGMNMVASGGTPAGQYEADAALRKSLLSAIPFGIGGMINFAQDPSGMIEARNDFTIRQAAGNEKTYKDLSAADLEARQQTAIANAKGASAFRAAQRAAADENDAKATKARIAAIMEGTAKAPGPAAQLRGDQELAKREDITRAELNRLGYTDAAIDADPRLHELIDAPAGSIGDDTILGGLQRGFAPNQRQRDIAEDVIKRRQQDLEWRYKSPSGAIGLMMSGSAVGAMYERDAAEKGRREAAGGIEDKQDDARLQVYKDIAEASKQRVDAEARGDTLGERQLQNKLTYLSTIEAINREELASHMPGQTPLDPAAVQARRDTALKEQATADAKAQRDEELRKTDSAQRIVSLNAQTQEAILRTNNDSYDADIQAYERAQHEKVESLRTQAAAATGIEKTRLTAQADAEEELAKALVASHRHAAQVEREQGQAMTAARTTAAGQRAAGADYAASETMAHASESSRLTAAITRYGDTSPEAAGARAENKADDAARGYARSQRYSEIGDRTAAAKDQASGGRGMGQVLDFQRQVRQMRADAKTPEERAQVDDFEKQGAAAQHRELLGGNAIGGHEGSAMDWYNQFQESIFQGAGAQNALKQLGNGAGAGGGGAAHGIGAALGKVAGMAAGGPASWLGGALGKVAAMGPIHNPVANAFGAMGGPHDPFKGSNVTDGGGSGGSGSMSDIGTDIKKIVSALENIGVIQ